MSRFVGDLVHVALRAFSAVSPTANNAADQLDQANAKDLSEARARFDLPRYKVGTTKEEIFGLPPRKNQ